MTQLAPTVKVIFDRIPPEGQIAPPNSKVMRFLAERGLVFLTWNKSIRTKAGYGYGRGASAPLWKLTPAGRAARGIN